MDEKRLTEIISKVTDDSTQVSEIIDNVVNEYSIDLDKVMDDIHNNVICDQCPAIMTIEKYFLELSNCLYRMCEKVERLGVFDSISRSKAQETYNMKYLEHQASNMGKTGAKKPTVAESTANAEMEALYDRTVNDIYSRSYKILKNKISAAETMVSTLSKILSHRIQESNMTVTQTGRQILNEGEVF
jgi:division protein CdvB (Snf7/Vps24/ESCRT-III family)